MHTHYDTLYTWYNYYQLTHTLTQGDITWDMVDLVFLKILFSSAARSGIACELVTEWCHNVEISSYVVWALTYYIGLLLITGRYYPSGSIIGRKLDKVWFCVSHWKIWKELLSQMAKKHTNTLTLSSTNCSSWQLTETSCIFCKWVYPCFPHLCCK